jgi:hypothetical protein
MSKGQVGTWTQHVFATASDDFPLLDLTARFAFKSQSSISFDLGRWSHSRFTFTHVGWIDAHHPCDGHIKTQLRIRIPAKYHVCDQMKSIIHLLFEALAIPSDETYETAFFYSDLVHGVENATNREGVTDRLY